MPINESYRTWIQRISELRPNQRKTQVQNFVWLVIGIFHSHSVSLSKIAGKVISTAKNVSTVRRLSRFLASSAVDVRSWYRPIAKAWLGSQIQQVGEIRLIVDGTKIGFGHQLLMVNMAYRRRAVPIAWSWVRHVCGHSSGKQQISLLKYVRSLIPQIAPVFWLETVNLAQSPSYGSWNNGVGSLSCDKKAIQACGSMNKQAGKEWRRSLHMSKRAPGVQTPA